MALTKMKYLIVLVKGQRSSWKRHFHRYYLASSKNLIVTIALTGQWPPYLAQIVLRFVRIISCCLSQLNVHCSQRGFCYWPKVGFCSTLCRDEACQSYHQTECGLTDFLNRANVGNSGLLAFRTVSKVPLHKLEAVLQQPVPNAADFAETFYDSTDYSSIYHLITNTNLRSVADLFKRAVMAVYLAFVWKFSRGSESDWHTVAAVLLQHLQNFPCNVHAISQLRIPAGGPHVAHDACIMQAHLSDVGAAAFACLSLINHSCDPNVVRYYYGDLATVTVIRLIRQGEEIFDNYGYHYAVHELAERKEAFRNQYYFDCSCLACCNRWPLFDQTSQSFAPSSKELKASSALFNKQLATFMTFSCQADKAALQQASQVFSSHISLLDLHFVQKPVGEYNKAQEALKQCLALEASVFYDSFCQ